MRETRSVGTLRARLLLNLLTAEWAPALALGLLTLSRYGELEMPVATAGLTLVAAAKLRPYRESSSLMPFAGFIAWIAPVGVGACAIFLLSLGDGLAGAGDAGTAALGAYAVLGAGALVRARFRRSRPLRVAVIGTVEAASALAPELQAHAISDYRLVGFIDPVAVSPIGSSAVPCIGTLPTIRHAVIEHELDLLICAPESGLGGSRQAILEGAIACLDLPVRLIQGEDVYETILGRVPLPVAGPWWFEPMLNPRTGSGGQSLARVRDTLLAILLSPVALILFGACALAIALSDGAPILHRQRRIGAGGREFTVTKLRSMRDYVEGDPWWAQEDDPRITPIGSFLRRSHLDELPQLWSVLKGEMSLVGPRPEVPAVVERLEKSFPYYDRRHLVKPGLTGWAQVRCGYAGSDSGSAHKLCFDLYYLKHRSFIFDLLIMVETLRVVLVGGQYGLQEAGSGQLFGGEQFAVVPGEPSSMSGAPTLPAASLLPPDPMPGREAPIR